MIFFLPQTLPDEILRWLGGGLNSLGDSSAIGTVQSGLATIYGKQASQGASPGKVPFRFSPRNGNGNGSSNNNPPRIGNGGGGSLTNGQGIAPPGGGSGGGSNSKAYRAANITDSKHQYVRDAAKRISAISFAKKSNPPSGNSNS